MAEQRARDVESRTGVPGPIGSAGARGVAVPADAPYGDFHPAVRTLREQFGPEEFAVYPLVVNPAGTSDQACVRVPPERLLEVMQFLHTDEHCQFEQLCDLTCVDYLNFPEDTDRFAVIYSLLSLSLEHRLWIKCFVDGADPAVASVTGVWRAADWLEREVYDMFGVRFIGHPDLRRLLTWEGFPAYPLRKDYPLRGRGEREACEVFPRDVS